MSLATQRACSSWAVRIALAAAFLSAVADRFGLWGPPGAPSIAWGDWQHFRSYSDTLNAWAPPWLQALLAYTATGLEVVLGLALVALPKQAFVPALSAVLLCAFALAMTFAVGPKAPLNYAVWVAAAAAWLLATDLQARTEERG